MEEPPVVGFIGVGLMGWGMAKNAVEKGFPLRVVAHRKREAVDDLVGRGAVECADVAEMAGQCDITVLCVTGAPQVEANVATVAGNARPGHVIIDTSTSEPDMTARLAGELDEKGMALVDAPLSRTPVQAWSGELTTYVSGDPATVERVQPLLATWASAIIPVEGPAGTAHAVKLVNNLVSLGYAALWSECYATIRKLGVAPGTFREIVTNSGMNCPNFQNFSKYVVDGDPEGHKFTLANGAKDLAYYERMATGYRATTLMSDGVLQTLKLAVSQGMGERYMAEMVDVVLKLNGDAPVAEPEEESY